MEIRKGVAGTLIRDASLSAPGERNERNRCTLIKSRIRTPLGKSSAGERAPGRKLKRRAATYGQTRHGGERRRLCNLVDSKDERVAYFFNCRGSHQEITLEFIHSLIQAKYIIFECYKKLK